MYTNGAWNLEREKNYSFSVSSLFVSLDSIRDCFFYSCFCYILCELMACYVISIFCRLTEVCILSGI